jgi:tRNA-dihydrouridine synthase 1
VHGRTKEQKGLQTGDADWEAIKAIRQVVGIPLIANGNIALYQDIQRCMDYTGVDGVMSAWGLLCDPAFFQGPADPTRTEVKKAREWINWEEQYNGRGVHLRRTKLHLFKRLYHTIANRPLLREHLSLVETREDLNVFMRRLENNEEFPAFPDRPPKPNQQEQEDTDEWVLFEI